MEQIKLTKDGLKFLTIVLGLLFVVGLVYVLQPETQNPLGKKILIFDNQVSLNVELANTPEEHAQGLSGRDSLGPDDGLLFIFDSPQQSDFWMKDMKFALDILWFNEHCELISLTENLSPETYPNTYRSATPTQFVLETNAGWARNHALVPGAKFDCQHLVAMN